MCINIQIDLIILKKDNGQFTLTAKTSSSAITEGPRDALSQLKSCQLLHNCMKNTAGRFFGLVTKHASDRRT